MITALLFWIIIKYKVKGAELIVIGGFILDIILFIQLGKFAG